MSYQGIREIACKHPSRTAVVYNGDVITYAAFATAIAETSRYLEQQGLAGASTIVVRVSCLIDCWVAVFALQELGHDTVCVASVSAIDGLSLHDIAGVVTTEIEAGISPIEQGSLRGERAIRIPNPVYKARDVLPDPAARKPSEVGGHVLYTSGTTGAYKKVFLDAALQHRRNAERIEVYRHCGADTVYNCTGFGLWTGVGYKRPLYVWQMGGCVVFEQRPQWFRYFLDETMTNSILIPDQVNELLGFLETHPSPGPVRDFYLLVASGFISNRMAEQLLSHVSSYLENIYGSTEINVPILRSVVNSPDDLHWMQPSGYRQVEIVDEQGKACPPGVEGELRVRYTDLDCSRYLHDREVSDKCFRSGYFYPGDMAVQRADGRIRILGRSADVVNMLGQKRAVAPFEDRIQKRLGLDAACLFSGLGDDGEVELVIALESRSRPNAVELDAVVNQFKQYGSVRVEVLDEFPRTTTGTRKIDRVALRKLVYSTD